MQNPKIKIINISSCFTIIHFYSKKQNNKITFLSSEYADVRNAFHTNKNYWRFLNYTS
jgi:hypothetical protein